MKRLSSSFGLISAVAVVVALSACAPATTAPSAGPTHGAEAHPTASPTPTQAAVPVVRVPVRCASLFTDAAASDLIGQAVKYHVDEKSQPAAITDIVARQYGSLVCLWGGQDRTDGGYDENVTVEVSPDAAAAFTSNLPNVLSQSDGAVKGTAGDQSEYLCRVQGDLQCSSNMLVGTYWVSAYVQTLGGTVTQAKANAKIQLVLAAVASALKSTTPLPAWVPPGADLPGFCANPGSLPLVKAAIGVNDFGPVGNDSGPSDAESFTQLSGKYTQCAWSSAASKGKFTYLQIAMLKGGAWVIPQLVGKSNDKNLLGAYSTMTIPGADAAVASCSVAAQQCDVMLSIGSTLVNISLDDPSPVLVTGALTKLVADIAAS